MTLYKCQGVFSWSVFQFWPFSRFKKVHFWRFFYIWEHLSFGFCHFRLKGNMRWTRNYETAKNVIRNRHFNRLKKSFKIFQITIIIKIRCEIPLDISYDISLIRYKLNRILSRINSGSQGFFSVLDLFYFNRASVLTEPLKELRTKL